MTPFSAIAPFGLLVYSIAFANPPKPSTHPAPTEHVSSGGSRLPSAGSRLPSGGSRFTSGGSRFTSGEHFPGGTRVVHGTRPGVRSADPARPDPGRPANGTRPETRAAGGGDRPVEPHPFADREGYSRPPDHFEHPAFGHPIYGYHRYEAWGWRHGDPWVADHAYWGGGFWGPVALGVTFGTVVTIAADSPGHLIFENYNLEPVACGPAGEVELYGPNDSVVCANPSALVPAGNYRIDPSTLELTPTQDE